MRLASCSVRGAVNVTVEQSFCCSTKTGDDDAATTEELCLMHSFDELTNITARRCCGVFMIPAPRVKLLTYLLTYASCRPTSQRPMDSGQYIPHPLCLLGNPALALMSVQHY